MVITPFSATTDPAAIVITTFTSARLPSSRIMSARLPGVIEPISRATPKRSAVLIVAIWKAVTGLTP
ncbi:hypothetical protein D3C73_1314630 [compost metagenome]